MFFFFVFFIYNCYLFSSFLIVENQFIFIVFRIHPTEFQTSITNFKNRIFKTSVVKPMFIFTGPLLVPCKFKFLFAIYGLVPFLYILASFAKDIQKLEVYHLGSIRMTVFEIKCITLQTSTRIV